MLFSFSADSILSFFLVIVSLIIAAVIWTRRPAPGASPFIILMLIIAVWIIIRTFDIAAVDFSVKVLLSKILYFTTVAISISWLFFALDYTGSKWWKRPRNILLLLAVPYVTLVIFLTRQWYAWDWMVIQPNVSASDALVVWSHGPMFWLQAVYIFSLLLAGIILLGRYTLSNPNISRLTMVAILLGTLFPIIGHAGIVLGLLPAEGLDITPFALTVTGVTYAIVIFRFRFFDIVPVAKTALVENIPDGILVLDNNNCIIEINPVAAGIAGRDKSSVVGGKIDAAWPELGRIIKETDWEGNRESRLNTSEGKHYFDISLTLIHNDQGVPIGRLIVLRDITERRLHQQQLETLYEGERRLSNNLKDEIEKRSMYTSAIVHELNTPLTSILAASELLESEVKEKNLLALVGNIRRSSLYLSQRVVDLIELARGETGTLEVYLQPLDMSGLIREVVDYFGTAAQDKGISLVMDVPELPLVSGDGNRLRQVLRNLIGNAIKYTEEGQVTVRASKNNRKVVLVQVKDTGSGIDKDRMENLFDPYRRNVTEGERLGGIGIGLALSKMFLELQNGIIWAESTPGRGSSFFFTIPLYEDIEDNS